MDGGDGARTVVVVVADRALEVLVGQVSSDGDDLALVEVLARLQLGVRRVGWTIRLVDPCPEICELLDLVGLADVLGAEPDAGADSALP